MRGGTATAKITLPANHPAYDAYKILDAESANDTFASDSKVTYSIKEADPWYDTLLGSEASSKGQKWFEDAGVKTDKEHYVKATTVLDAEPAARELAQWLVNNKPVEMGTPVTIEADVTSADLPYGYYLILSKTAVPAVVALTTADTSVDLSSKISDRPVIKKEIVNIDAGEDLYTTEAKAIVGSKIKFRITVSNKSGSATDGEIVVTDISDAGLIIDDQTIQATVDSASCGSSVEVTGGNATTFTYTIPTSVADTKDVIIEYTATLTGTTKNIFKNRAYYTYQSIKSVEVENTIITNNVSPDKDNEDKRDGNSSGPFTLTKVDKADNKFLKGAKFQVYTQASGGTPINFTNDGKAYQASTTSGVSIIDMSTETTVTLKGLAGTVYFEEVVVPKGYNKPAGRIPFNIDSAITNGREFDGMGTTNGQWTDAADPGFGIANASGALLPSTGGIGTTIFYIAGAILLLGAVVVLIVRRRMNEDN